MGEISALFMSLILVSNIISMSLILVSNTIIMAFAVVLLNENGNQSLSVAAFILMMLNFIAFCALLNIKYG